VKTLTLEAGHGFSWVRVQVEKNNPRFTRGELWSDGITGGKQNHVSIDVLENGAVRKM
jgi:hypothetical protein